MSNLWQFTYEFCHDLEHLFGFTFTDEEIVENDVTMRVVSVTPQAAERFTAFIDGRVQEDRDGDKWKLSVFRHKERGLTIGRTLIEEEDDESQEPDHD